MGIPLYLICCFSLTAFNIFCLYFIFFIFYLFIYLFILEIHVLLFIYLWLCWVFVSVWGLISSCGEWGPLFIAVHGPLTVAASLIAEHRLQTRRLSNCGSRAQLLRGMWDLSRPGHEPVSPALAGRFSTTAPPGKPLYFIFDCLINMCFGMFLLGFILYGTLCASWTWLTISFPILGKFSTIISSNIFSIPLFFSSSSGTPIIWLLVRLMLS